MKTDANAAPLERVPDDSAPINVDVLEHRAKAARERLLQAVDALDHRRHLLTKPTKAVPAGLIPAAVVTASVVAIGSLAAFAYSKRKKSALTRLASRVGRSEPSVLTQVAKHAGIAVLTFAVSEVGKVAVKKLMPSPQEVEREEARARVR